MLRRRNPQRSYFDAQSVPHRVAADSFYGRMGAVSDRLFKDDDLAEMYCAGNGRPSIPPSLMCGVLLLQFYDDVSDREAVERMKYDMRWKVALNLPLDFAGIDPSTLVVFRKRLVRHARERYAFDRLIEVGRAAGFIPERVTMLIDTTSAKGAGAVQDSYTLLRKGIRKLLKTAGFDVAGKRHSLSARGQSLVSRYLEQDRKAGIDWSDAEQRSAQLKVLAQDAEAALALTAEQMDDEEVRSVGWLLTKILGDDLDEDERGNPKIGRGTAPDRIISITDTEMRHGRKSARQRFDGFKVSVATEPENELILDITDMQAPGSDGQQLMPTIERVEQHAGVEVERVIVDGAYNSGDNLAACVKHKGRGVDVVTSFSRPKDPEVAKSAFDIDLEGQTIICPQGHSVTGKPGRDRKGRDILQFTFARPVCATCPLFEACVRSKISGRTVRTHAHEKLLQKTRARQATPEYKEMYRTRSQVERKIGEVARHGIRDTRYLGGKKRQLQRLWTGAAVNLKRLFTLAQDKGCDLATVFVMPEQSGEAMMSA